MDFKVPATCVDRFYDDPRSVVDFANSLEYTEAESGRWPGKRSKPLHEIDEAFFNMSVKKIMSLLFDFNHTHTNWVVSTYFQKIKPMLIEGSVIKNGWIHTDSGVVFSGIVYLNDGFVENDGTSIYSVKNGIQTEQLDTLYEKWESIKKDFYLNKKTTGYINALQENYDYFEKTIEYANVFNRMIFFDGSQYHAATFSDSRERLTQVFFVEELQTTSRLPIDRLRAEKL